MLEIVVLDDYAALSREAARRMAEVIRANPALAIVPATGDTPMLAYQELARLQGEERSRRFDLAHGPLLRFMLARLAPQRHRLVLTCHHILIDGWSGPVLVRESWESAWPRAGICTR